ncbi:MAG: cupredoxin domain-containing protein [Actinomycetota bacterium]
MRGTSIRLVLAICVALLAVGGTASAGGGGCHEPDLTEDTGTAVDVGKNCFGPIVLRVNAGDTVTWKNYDPVLHTLTAAGGVFDLELKPDEEFSFKFVNDGVYPYYCLLHPRMAGAVVVGNITRSQAAAPPVQPVAALGETSEDTTSSTGPALIAAFIAAPLSFAAGRILRTRK